jgi:hypothetical protein
LADGELCELVQHTVSPLEAHQAYVEGAGALQGPGCSTDPGRIASAVAHAAFHRATEVGARTPFSEHAGQHGVHHSGGKMDDITVVCAWVVHCEGTTG